MKTILPISLLFILLSVAASAQTIRGQQFLKNRDQRGFNRDQITRPEKFELRRDALQYKLLRHRAQKDGIVTPFEQRKLRKAKCEGRRDLVRFRINGRKRVI